MNDDNEAKKRLHNILKNLIKLTKKGDIVGFKRLNMVYSSLMTDTFGKKTLENGEGWEWNYARNQLAAVLNLKEVFEKDKINKEEYDNMTYSAWIKALDEFKALKRYLR